MSELPVVFSFWHGPLSYLERLCIASFLEQGHRFRLYSYGHLDGLPKGCELVDAEQVISRSRMFFYKENLSPSVFANLLRLELFRHETGVWVDCDVFCIRPFSGLGQYVFGYEDDPDWTNFWHARLNNAVLRIPPETALHSSLQAVFDSNSVPPGVPLWRRWEIQFRRLLGISVPLHHMQFGSTGPAPLTYFVRKLGLERFAAARSVFYPLRYGEAAALLEPDSDITPALTEESLAVHLWHSALTDRGRLQLAAPAAGSFLAREAMRLGISLQ